MRRRHIECVPWYLVQSSQWPNHSVLWKEWNDRKPQWMRMKRIQPNRVCTFHFVRIRKFPIGRMPFFMLNTFNTNVSHKFFIFIDNSFYWTESISKRCVRVCLFVFLFRQFHFERLESFATFSLFLLSYNLFWVDAPFAGYNISSIAFKSIWKK